MDYFKDNEERDKKENNPQDTKEDNIPETEEMPSDLEFSNNEDSREDDELNKLRDEMIFLKSRLKNSEDEVRRFKNESETLKERLTRLNSEYENYRNRTDREKDEISDECTVKVLKEIVSPIDNLERALVAETDDLEGLKEGVQLTLNQFKTAFGKLGAEEISTEEGFDPELHEAVMHENDPSKDKNIVGEVFLKGYKKGNKVIRHSVVKVIN